MAEKRKISLVLADVDGTLVNEEKVLTERAQAAVQSLHRAEIRFAITSGRPPKGMAMLLDALQLDTPIAGFNGGLFVKPDLTILERKTVPPDIAAAAIKLILDQASMSGSIAATTGSSPGPTLHTSLARHGRSSLRPRS
jgi:HAD superfamily hydrolase (TIGR01484 family)